MTRKRVLLIAPDFFDYYVDITRALEDSNWQVVYFSDRPPKSASWYKIGLRKFKFLFHKHLLNRYKKFLKNKKKFDEIIIVKGEGVTVEVVELLKNNYCLGKVRLYLWDSLKNSPGARKILKHVDQVQTFDPDDSEKYNLELLPLFYIQNSELQKSSELARDKKKSDFKKWDLCFIGSVHGDRLKVLKRIKKSLNVNYSFFIFIYFPSRIIYYFRRLFDRSISDFSSEQLSLKPLEKCMAQDVFLKSNIVVDIHNEGQAGLTIRTLEALAMGKKIITTNSSIKKYDFYNSDYICVIDRSNPIIPEDFVISERTAEISNQLARFELKNWCKLILK